MRLAEPSGNPGITSKRMGEVPTRAVREKDAGGMRVSSGLSFDAQLHRTKAIGPLACAYVSSKTWSRLKDDGDGENTPSYVELLLKMTRPSILSNARASGSVSQRRRKSSALRGNWRNATKIAINFVFASLPAGLNVSFCWTTLSW